MLMAQPFIPKKEKVFTGNHKWTYVFTDMNGKIKSHRAEPVW